jgi:UPF0271 protein
MIEQVNQAALQALKIASQRVVNTLSGTTIPLEAGTLCVHGDSPHALLTLKLSRSLLEGAGIRIMAP